MGFGLRTLRDVATPLEASALREITGTWAGDAMRLGDVMDDQAAVFLVHGEGGIGARTLEPVTYLAAAVERDAETMLRIRTLLSSLDDLGIPPRLRRVTFAATEQAAGGAGVLSDLRSARFGTAPVHTRLDELHAGMREYGSYTGFYQHGSDELVLGPRTTRQVLHEGFQDVTSTGRELPPSYAARIPPHELFHSVQPWGDALPEQVEAIRLAVTEAAASISGTLRAGTTMRELGMPVRDIDAVTLQSRYDEYSRIVSALARLGGARLDDPVAIATFERSMASQRWDELLAELVQDAAAHRQVPAAQVHAAAEAGFHQRSFAAFESGMRGVGVGDVDGSLDWVLVESRRRAGAVAAA